MNDLEYTYAVARIRALEASLFSSTEIERLLACSDEEQCLQFLNEKGWGDGTGSMDASDMLKREEERTWEVIGDVAPPWLMLFIIS